MPPEQFIQQYGLAIGLLLWAAAQILMLLLASWRARMHAEDVVNQERKVVTEMLTKRDEDARTQQEKTDKLEGEVYLFKSTMSIEREESAAQLDDLSVRLDAARIDRDQLAARLSESERRYQEQLTAAHVEIDSLRAQIVRLEGEIRAMEGERQKLVDALYREMRTTARLTSELAFMRGQHDVVERVLARIQPGTPVPETTLDPSPV